VTAFVVTVKVWDVCPAGTRTDAGTVAFVLSDDNATEYPPTGAGTSNVTVPVAFVPPDTDVGATRIRALGGTTSN